MKIKSYDVTDNFRDRIHTIRVTFQWLQYKGHIVYNISGNCRGLGVMDVDFDIWDMDDISNLKENDCNFKWDDINEVWNLTLKDDNGNECDMGDIEEHEIEDYVVAVEIIDCKLSEK